MPSLRERISAFVRPGDYSRVGTDPLPMPVWGEYFGKGIGNQPSHEALLRESLGVADMATRAIANRVSTLNPLVKTTRGTGATQVDEIIDDHPLKVLLDRPHPNMTRSTFQRLTTQYIITVGEAYWLKIGSGLDIPVELHPIMPSTVTPIVRDGLVQGYIVNTHDGQRVELAADMVVRFYFPDPESWWTSEGYLGPNGTTADSQKFAGQHMRSHYQNDATPKTVLEAGEGAQPFRADEKRRFWSRWREHYSTRGDGDAAGVPAILPAGYRLAQLAQQTGSDIVPLLEYWRDEQLANFGTPRTVLGQVVSGDRSTAETNQYVFDRHTVKPIADLIAESITLQLAIDFDEAVFVEFEPYISDDKQFGLQQEGQDLDKKVRTVNQVREDRGLDTVDYGDVPIGTLADTPYTGDEFDATLPDDAAAFEDEEDEEERAPRMRGWFAADAEWQRQVRREKKFAPAMTSAVRKAFADQRDVVLAKLAQLDEQRGQRITIDVDDLLDGPRMARIMRKHSQPVRVHAFSEIMAETLEGLIQDSDFVFTDDLRKVLRTQGSRFVRQANRTTERMLTETLGDAAADESAEEIASRVRKVYRTRRAQGTTIGRTEIQKASQSGATEGYRVSGVVERKQWNTSHDDRVRDSHEAAAGQLRDLDEPFRLGPPNVELADAPGIGAFGRSLSAANSINCRCFVTPIVEEEES